MADIVLMNRGRELLKKLFGGRDERSGYLLAEYHSWDIAKHEDDFWGDVIRGLYDTGIGTGATAAAIDVGKVNGQITLKTGATDNAHSGLAMGRTYRGDQNPVLVARLALDVITTVKVEVGFADSLASAISEGEDSGVVKVKATPTATATDGVVWCLDTDDNANWEGLGVANTTVATTVEAGISPVAATFEYLVVSLRDGLAHFDRFDAQGRHTYGADKAWQTGAVTSTVLLTPWVFVQARSAAAHILSLDYLAVWQRRTT